MPPIIHKVVYLGQIGGSYWLNWDRDSEIYWLYWDR